MPRSEPDKISELQQLFPKELGASLHSGFAEDKFELTFQDLDEVAIRDIAARLSRKR